MFFLGVKYNIVSLFNNKTLAYCKNVPISYILPAKSCITSLVKYVSEKVFQQKIDQLTSQDIENAVNDTIKSMDPNDKNEKIKR